MIAGHTTCHMRSALPLSRTGLIDLANNTNGHGLEQGSRNEESS